MKKSIPISAYQFKAAGAPVYAEAAGDGEARKFNGTAYNGGVLDHYYWERVAFDVSSTTAAADVTPILVDHDPGKRAGFAALSFDNGAITITGGTLLDNEHGQAIASESDQGFPWQMSVYIEPGSIEKIKPGEKVTINGAEVVGPVHIFKNGRIREVSFTAIGVDSTTTAAAMSAAQQREDQRMTIEELQAQVAELQGAVSAANGRADAAEAELATITKEARMSAVKSLFSAIGRDFTDSAAAPYLAMSAEAFSAVSADLLAIKPKPDPALFSQQATGGTDGGKEQGQQQVKFSAADIYAKRSIR